MITVPVPTIEKPITVVDYISELTRQCRTVTDVREFGNACPIEIRQNERFQKATAARLAAIHGRKAAA